MKSKRLERCGPVAPRAVRLLCPEEMEALRQEMKASSQWMKDELARRRSEGAALSARDQLSEAVQPK